MKAIAALSAIGALTLSTHVFAGEQLPDPSMSIHIGTFSNSGWGQINYQGDFADRISATQSAPNGVMYPTRIAIDLTSILQDAGYDAFSSVTVRDTGLNAYGIKSPGADVDLFAFEGLSDNLDVLLSYDGPVVVHQQEDPDILATRVAEINALSGYPHNTSQRHVSLGDQGKLTANILGLPGNSGGGADGPIDPLPRGAPVSSGVTLLLSESGMGESYDVYVTPATIPTPGALVLLGLAGVCNRRRRRSE